MYRRGCKGLVMTKLTAPRVRAPVALAENMASGSFPRPSARIDDRARSPHGILPAIAIIQ